MKKAILIIGGARSGKSHYAREFALKSPQPVLFVATAEAGDEEMKHRIEEHRKVRPSTWETLEVTNHIGHQIQQNVGKAQTVIVDCITLLVSNILGLHGDSAYSSIDAARIESEVIDEMNELVECMNQTSTYFIIVTNEVGLGIVPANKNSRLYRDLLGRANQILAQHVNEIYLMVAGLPLLIKSADSIG